MSWATRGLGGPALWTTRGLGPTYLVLPPLPGGTVTLSDIAPAIHFLVLVPDVDLRLPADSSMSLSAATVEMRMAPYCRLEMKSPTVSFGFAGPSVRLTSAEAPDVTVETPLLSTEVSESVTTEEYLPLAVEFDEAPFLLTEDYEAILTEGDEELLVESLESGRLDKTKARGPSVKLSASPPAREGLSVDASDATVTIMSSEDNP